MGTAAILLLVAMLGMSACQTQYYYVGPFLSGPAAETVTVGATATFAVTATGKGPMQYQWMKNGSAIAGAVASTYVTPATVSTDNGALFAVTVSNGFKTAVSAKAMLTVITPAAPPPVITIQPVAGSGCSGTGVVLSVTATNATSYQWELNGSAIAGATGSVYTATASGNYSVLVSNGAAAVLSNVVVVSIGSSITMQPVSVSVLVGQVGTFTVAAAGQGPFAYQWFKISPGMATGVAISGANSATYVSPVTVGGDDGTQFYATVTDACGTVYTSTSATLSVNAGDVPPTIVLQPVGQLVAPGATATFTALAVGTPTITYQWYALTAAMPLGGAIAGATGTSYTVPASGTTTADNGDLYWVVATNAYGSAKSLTATLTVGTGILIVTQPVSQYVQVGQTATFTVVAQSTLPLTYQWYEAAAGTANFVAVAGATGTSYSVVNARASDSGNVLQVVVSNTAQSVTSNNAGLFVGALNQINPLCDGSWLPHGSTVEIGAGTGACSFQLTDAGAQSGQLVWQELLATGNVSLSFTVTMSKPSNPPGDGFTLTFADPSQGATLTSLGGTGSGLGAQGINGLALAFDTYENGPPDEPIVPYVGVTQSNGTLWENPWINTNDNIAPIVVRGQTVVTQMTMTLYRGQMTVLQNGTQIFTGAVSPVPATAYLMFTASTGSSYETVVISNFTGTVGAP